MEFLSSPEAGLAGLFLYSFLSATLLPGGSEAALLALVVAHPELALPALMLATAGNTAGGMVTWWMGRALPEKWPPQKSALVRRWGSPVLLLAWVPVVGDLFCLAAGWLRLPWRPCLLWMAAGKGVRYAAVVFGMALL